MGRHEPREMVSKSLDLHMSIQMTWRYPLSFRIDIIEAMCKVVEKLKYVTEFVYIYIVFL